MSEEKVTPCIEVGALCPEDGEWGCDKCYNPDGTSACCEGSQPWGCGAGQKPMCKSTEEIEKLREEANEPE